MTKTTPACWGCECGVPVRNGQHEEPADMIDDCGKLVDTGMVYTYPCTRPPTEVAR